MEFTSTHARAPFCAVQPRAPRAHKNEDDADQIRSQMYSTEKCEKIVKMAPIEKRIQLRLMPCLHFVERLQSSFCVRADLKWFNLITNKQCRISVYGNELCCTSTWRPMAQLGAMQRFAWSGEQSFARKVSVQVWRRDRLHVARGTMNALPRAPISDWYLMNSAKLCCSAATRVECYKVVAKHLRHDANAYIMFRRSLFR